MCCILVLPITRLYKYTYTYYKGHRFWIRMRRPRLLNVLYQTVYDTAYKDVRYSVLYETYPSVKRLRVFCSLREKRCFSPAGLWTRDIEKHPIILAVYRSYRDSLIKEPRCSVFTCLSVPVQVAGTYKKKKNRDVFSSL